MGVSGMSTGKLEEVREAVDENLINIDIYICVYTSLISFRVKKFTNQSCICFVYRHLTLAQTSMKLQPSVYR